MIVRQPWVLQPVVADAADRAEVAAAGAVVPVEAEVYRRKNALDIFVRLQVDAARIRLAVTRHRFSQRSTF